MANFYLNLQVTESNVNIANNTSVVTVKVTVVAQNGYRAYNYYTTSVSVSCGGQTGSFAVGGYNIPTNGSVYLGSYAFTVGHNADGFKSVDISASFFSGNSYIGNISAQTSKTLTVIPRATTPALTYADAKKRMGTNLTIALPAASSAFTHNVSYRFGTLSGVIAGGIKTSAVWSIPKTLAAQIPNALSGTGSIVVDTYNGGAKIGTKEVGFTASVSDEMVPSFTSISAVRVDNGVPGSFGIYVQNYSKVTLSINGAAGNNGSAIKSYSLTGDGYTSSKQTDTFGVLKNAGTIVFTAMITDSRGRTASKNISITVFAYQPPTLTFTAERCTANGTISQEGTYLLIKPVYRCASVNGKNYITNKAFRCGSYSDTTCASGGSCIIGAGTIAINQQYDVAGEVTDAIGSVAAMAVHVGTSAVPFNIKANGKGAAFGKYAEKDGVLESNYNIEIKGNPVFPFILKQNFYGFDTIPNWLRTPKMGLIPYQQNSAGESYIGSDLWPFIAGYFKDVVAANGFSAHNTSGKNVNVIRMNTSNQTELPNNDVKIVKTLTCDTVYFNNVKNIDTKNAHILWSIGSDNGDIWNMTWGNGAHNYFHYSTNIGAFGVNCWASDKSLKNHIHDTKVDRVLEKISQIKHVEFDWKSNGEHLELGYVADDLEKVLPCLVYDVAQSDKDGIPNGSYLKHINHTTVIPLITMGIQELIQERDYLWEFDNAVCDELLKYDNEISALNKENEELKLRLSKLEVKLG